MEEKGISNIIYIVISVVFVLISFVFRKKKQEIVAPQKTTPPPDFFPKIDENPAPEEFFPKKKEEIFTPVTSYASLKSRSTLTKLEVIPEEDEVTASHSFLNNKHSEKSVGEKTMDVMKDFDPVKAVIYSEIMTRKY
ncbi:MAG: hypothetical protein CVU05_05605 [Bacteroidetes bacterium HGW-Bacteroidetes-21]|nr:MAG: hypothetical protein CVU05_05605 [Bacteroidetes bacterium HGW-Bacteroidetes-21]